jgi:hypothetical protein
VQYVVASGLAPGGRDHEGSPLARRESCRSAIDERDLPQKLGPYRPSLGRRHLIDHHGHGAAPSQNRARSLHGPKAGRQHHALTRSSLLPESIDSGSAKVLGHHEKRGAGCYRAGRQVPVSRVRRRDDDAASASHRAAPKTPCFADEVRVTRRRPAASGQPQKLHGGHAE